MTLNVPREEKSPESIRHGTEELQSSGKFRFDRRLSDSEQGSIMNTDDEMMSNLEIDGMTTSELSSPLTETECLLRDDMQDMKDVQIAHAKSRMPGFKPTLELQKESDVVRILLQHSNLEESTKNHAQDLEQLLELPDPDTEFTEFILSDFEIYLPFVWKHAWELRSLNCLATKIAHSSFLLDGILSVGPSRHYVQGVPFKICSIGNYGVEHHHVGSEIWVQSQLNKNHNIHYRLQSPTPEYKRFHDGFMWLANLAKHFVDYCQESASSGVSVWDFRTNFSQWIKEKHSSSSEFRAWYDEYGRKDFRGAVVRNIHFLYKEAIGVYPKLDSLRIWNELLHLNAVPYQEPKENMTVVTPYVYECFKDSRFGHLLKAVTSCDMSEAQHQLQGEVLHLTGNADLSPPLLNSSVNNCKPASKSLRTDVESEAQHTQEVLVQRGRFISSIKAGDVLSVTKDGENSVWKDEVSRWKAADNCWYIYVQRAHVSKRGGRSFDAIWLYKPSDTMCAKMKYPFPNELFLSDNCTCLQVRVKEDEVIDKINVNWHASSSTSGFFIRQTYLENVRFVTLKDEHKTCEHLRPYQPKLAPELRYPVGQTVLAPPRRKTKNALEVYEIAQHICPIPNSNIQSVMLRRLKRRIEVDGKGRPNELVYTTRMERLNIEKIESSCFVRFYSQNDVADGNIPAPYCRDGTGNAFYISSKLVEANGSLILEPLGSDIPRTLIQGFDPSVKPIKRKLRGLDLYCGGGNFGRGLEEGGAIHNEWAVDISKCAIHTYYVNQKDPTDCSLYFGSVDDMFMEALKGNPKGSDHIPLPGDVEFLAAGSPCQGFSNINMHKQNEKALKNQSMVTSVAAYIDFYRPKYGMLENVLGMAQKGKGRDEDVLSQLICAIVGIGYQVRMFVLDAWSFGSPQSRTRLFVSFAAPGLQPAQPPAQSHAHPTNVRSRTLGKLANGEAFGQRTICPTPFQFLSAGKSTEFLPVLGDGATAHCTSHPDHIALGAHRQQLWDQIRCIPTHPRGMDLNKAWKGGEGVLSTAKRNKFFGSQMRTREGGPREMFSPGSNAFGRINPELYFSTVLCSTSVYDGRVGARLHWDETRLLSLLEIRIAQGFPEHEILLGSKKEYWGIVGNSVVRGVALGLGLSVRDAWLRSDEQALSSPAEARINMINEEALFERLRRLDEMSGSMLESEIQQNSHRLGFAGSLGTLEVRRDFSLPTHIFGANPNDFPPKYRKSVGLFKARRSSPPPRITSNSTSESQCAITSRTIKIVESAAKRQEHLAVLNPSRAEISESRVPRAFVAVQNLSSSPCTMSSKRTDEALSSLSRSETPKTAQNASPSISQTPPMASSSTDLTDDEEEISEAIFRKFLNKFVPPPREESPSSRMQGDNPCKRPSLNAQASRTPLPNKRSKLGSQSDSLQATHPHHMDPDKVIGANSTEHLDSPTTTPSSTTVTENYTPNSSPISEHTRSVDNTSPITISSSSSESLPPTTPQRLSRINARIIHTPRAGIRKTRTPPKPKPKAVPKHSPVIIDLTSDDENRPGDHTSHRAVPVPGPNAPRMRNAPSATALGTVGESVRAEYMRFRQQWIWLQQREHEHEHGMESRPSGDGSMSGDVFSASRQQHISPQMHNPPTAPPEVKNERENENGTQNGNSHWYGPRQQVSRQQDVRQYQPVDNSRFDVYASTYRYMGAGRRR